MWNRLNAWLLPLVILNVAVTAFLVMQLVFFQPRSSPVPVSNTPGVEVAILRAQLEATQRYHGDVLSTLWGALASIATVIVVVTVLGNIQNARLYDRDKLAIQEAAQSQLDARANELTAYIEKRVVELSKEIRSEITMGAEKLREENTTTLGTALNEAKDELIEQITEVAIYSKHLGAAVATDIGAMALTNRDYLDALAYNHLALTYAVDISRRRPERGRQLEEHAIDSIEVVVESALTAQANYPKSFIDVVVATLAQVHPDYQEKAQQLITNLRKIEIVAKD